MKGGNTSNSASPLKASKWVTWAPLLSASLFRDQISNFVCNLDWKAFQVYPLKTFIYKNQYIFFKIDSSILTLTYPTLSISMRENGRLMVRILTFECPQIAGPASHQLGPLRSGPVRSTEYTIRTVYEWYAVFNETVKLGQSKSRVPDVFQGVKRWSYCRNIPTIRGGGRYESEDNQPTAHAIGGS